jgi:hypothetical protein
MFNSGEYVLAKVVGFCDRHGDAITEVRCKVTEARDGMVWVVTADLRAGAGCRLVLDETKVSKLDDTVEVVRHRNGLISFG